MLATDENYAAPCAVVIESLLRNTADPSAIAIYVYGSNLTEQTQQRLKAVADRHDASLTIHQPDMSRLQDLPLRENFTADAYNKVLAPDDFSDQNRLLYLDCDLLVERDVQPLFEIDLGEKVAGAVPNGPAPFITEFNRRHGFPLDEPVFNTGVLLVDPEKWKERGVAEQVIRWIAKNEDRLIYRDQDGINAILKEHIKPLGSHWNVEARHYRDKWMGISERWDEVEGDDVILHYTGPRKPWKRWVYVPRQRSYREYLEATPFSSSDFMARNRLEFELSRTVGGLRMMIEAAHMRAGQVRQEVVEYFTQV